MDRQRFSSNVSRNEKASAAHQGQPSSTRCRIRQFSTSRRLLGSNAVNLLEQT